MKKSPSKAQAKSPSRSTSKAAGKQKADAKAPVSKDSPSGSHQHLGHALEIADIAYTLTSPLLQSIHSLLDLASQVINSDEASVITRDEKRAGLKFLVATGSFANELKKIRIPPGRGIAGFVFTTGQPLAVSDVSREESFYAEVDQATGHSTHAILATPLRVREETIGVLEFVNRTGEPPYEPFSPMEMDRAAQFADTIALLVDAHEQANLVESFLTHALRGDVKIKSQKLNKWISNLRAAPEHKELLLLAAMLRDVAAQGEEERRLCLDVLTAISRWTLKHSSPQSDFSIE